MHTIKQFAHRHDDIPAFHVSFALLTFISAAMLSLGWFAVLIIIHMVLDVAKYREVHGFTWRETINATLHESLLELMFFSMALLISVYFHSSTGFLNISGMLRAEATLIYITGVVVPKFIIMEQVLKALTHISHYLHRLKPNAKRANLTVPEKIYASFIVCSVVLLMAAPYVTNTPPEVINHVIFHELSLTHLV